MVGRSALFILSIVLAACAGTGAQLGSAPSSSAPSSGTSGGSKAAVKASAGVQMATSPGRSGPQRIFVAPGPVLLAMVAKSQLTLKTGSPPKMGLLAMTASGATKWHVEVPCPSVSRSHVAANRLICIDREQRKAIGIDLRDGSVAWTTALDGTPHVARVSGSRFVIDVDRKATWVLRVDNGAVVQRWQAPNGALEAAALGEMAVLALPDPKRKGRYLLTGQAIGPALDNGGAPRPLQSSWQMPFRGASLGMSVMGSTLLTWPAKGAALTLDARSGAHLRTDLEQSLPERASAGADIAVWGRFIDGTARIGAIDPRTHVLKWSAKWPFATLPHAVELHGSISGGSASTAAMTWHSSDGWLGTRLDGTVIHQQAKTGEFSGAKSLVVTPSVVFALHKRAGGGLLARGHPLTRPSSSAKKGAKNPPEKVVHAPFVSTGAHLEYVIIKHKGISKKSGMFRGAKVKAISFTVRTTSPDLDLGWEIGGGAETGTIVVKKQALQSAPTVRDVFNPRAGIVELTDRTSMVLSRAVFDAAAKSSPGKLWHRFTLRRHGKGKAQALLETTLVRGPDGATYAIADVNGVALIVQAHRSSDRGSELMFLSAVVPP